MCAVFYDVCVCVCVPAVSPNILELYDFMKHKIYPQHQSFHYSSGLEGDDH